MTKSEFMNLIGKDIVVDYNFNGQIQHWYMRDFYIEDGQPQHRYIPLIMDVFIPKCFNPHTER